MPPRLAYHKLKPSSSALDRTIWDEVCSIFLCFISALVTKDKIRAVDSMGLLGKLLDRMLSLCRGDAALLLRQYQSDPIVGAMRSAVAKLFGNKEWMRPPPEADSLDWWNKLREILDSFVPNL
jgi:hypothetical protein